MTLTIELAPERAEALGKEAARRGVSREEYVRALVEENLPLPPAGEAGRFRLSDAQFESALDRFASDSESLPVLPPEADRREWIYGDHE